MGVRFRKVAAAMRALAGSGVLGPNAQAMAERELELRVAYQIAKDELEEILKAIEEGRQPTIDEHGWAEVGELVKVIKSFTGK